jgi:hypothetical protein
MIAVPWRPDREGITNYKSAPNLTGEYLVFRSTGFLWYRIALSLGGSAAGLNPSPSGRRVKIAIRRPRSSGLDLRRGYARRVQGALRFHASALSAHA